MIGIVHRSSWVCSLGHSRTGMSSIWCVHLLIDGVLSALLLCHCMLASEQALLHVLWFPAPRCCCSGVGGRG
jgi:hypothetical protein